MFFHFFPQDESIYTYDTLEVSILTISSIYISIYMYMNCNINTWYMCIALSSHNERYTTCTNFQNYKKNVFFQIKPKTITFYYIDNENFSLKDIAIQTFILRYSSKFILNAKGIFLINMMLNICKIIAQ